MTEAVRPAAVRAATEALIEAGAAPGRRIAIQVEPDATGLALLLGAARTGATLSLLHPGWSGVEVVRVLRRFEPAFVVDGRDRIGGEDAGTASPDPETASPDPETARPQVGEAEDSAAEIPEPDILEAKTHEAEELGIAVFSLEEMVPRGSGLDAADSARPSIPSGTDPALPAIPSGADSALPSIHSETDSALPSILPSGTDPAPTWVLWTSGTSSGTPRGVVLSHDALVASARGTARRLDLRASDRWLCTLSPAHVGGLVLVLRAALLGSTLLGAGRHDIRRVSRALEDAGVTHASMVPTQLLRLLDHREGRRAPASLRALLVGGAATPPGLLRRALDLGYPVASTWGMTEAASQVATAEPARVRRKPGTVGSPLSGIEVRVDRGPGTGDDEPGELWVRGPTLATGVFEGPHRPPRPLTDDDGWYRTGDLGAFDAEGDLRISGRLSDRIISGGVNVAPAEVEAAILRHPDVHEVVVAGVPDPEWGEVVTAWVVVRDGAEPLTLDRLRDFLRPTLSAPKCPRVLHQVEAIPRNANGKVDRARLAGWERGLGRF